MQHKFEHSKVAVQCHLVDSFSTTNGKKTNQNASGKNERWKIDNYKAFLGCDSHSFVV